MTLDTFSLILQDLYKVSLVYHKHPGFKTIIIMMNALLVHTFIINLEETNEFDSSTISPNWILFLIETKALKEKKLVLLFDE